MAKAVKNNSNGKGKWYWNWLSKQIYMLLAALLVVLIILFSTLKYITRHNQELEVPSFEGMSLEAAARVAEKHSLRLEVTDSVYMNKMAPGVVFRQNPEATGKVKKNRRILLTINAKMPKKVNMPYLVGYSLRQAISELSANQLKVGKLLYIQDIATNNVIAQLYRGANIGAGKPIPSGSEIDLKLGINEGEDETYIPELSSIPYQYLKEHLVDNSLNLRQAIFDNTVKTYSDSLEAIVYKQSPSASNVVSVPMGTEVTVYLSKDKSLIQQTPSQGEEQ